MWNMVYLATGAMFIVLLLMVFFKKKMINTKENRLFKLIILSNTIGYLIEIPLQVLVRAIGIDSLAIDILCRLYMMSITINYTIFTIYVFVICLDNSKEKYDKKIKNISTVVILLEILVIGLLAILPFEKYYDASKMYIYGNALDLLKLCIVCHIGIYFILLIKNFKQLKDKKYLPIYIIIILLVFMTILNSVDPSILITNMIVTFICYTMSFTIENPDMKIIEEVHKAKEISDNANEEKAVFLYNMTNEIRDITKDINVNASNILEETSNKKINVESINDSARNIQENTAMFTTITNEILDVSSIDSASIKIYSDKYNVALIIKELVQTYGAKCKKKNLEFRSDIQSDLPNYLYGDSVGFKTVLTTILDNSVKYTDEGYIEFDVSFIKKKDVVRLVINIEDSGVGIKADELNKVFANKEEIEEKDKLNLSSTLLNAKKLITLMGGTLIPKSSYGSGTSMKIILDQRIAPDDGNLSKYEEMIDKKKVLLVANDDTSKEITKLLKDSAIILETVASGKECLDKIREKEDYDLILLEEEITPLDGIKVMKKLNDIRSFNINAILLSGKEYDEKEYKELGFSYVITKPISEKIVDIINKY